MNQPAIHEVRVTHIGGPTALIELGGLRLLTDPAFDPAGTEYAAMAPTMALTTAIQNPPRLVR